MGALPARVLNIGNHRSEAVSTLIALLEQALGRRAILRDAPRPAADVQETFASVDAIAALTGFAPTTSLAEGIPRFVAWFRAWHGREGAVSGNSGLTGGARSPTCRSRRAGRVDLPIALLVRLR